MYICNECGYLREELNETYEFVGNFTDGNNGYYELDTICSCGGEYVEAVKCENCGEWTSELHNGVCDNCLAEEATVANAQLYGEVSKAEIKVNGFYAKVFGEAQINSILQNAFFELTTKCERISKNKANEFCLEDKDDFGKFIKEWI